MAVIDAERRKHSRRDTDLDIQLKTPATTADVEIVNVSLGGARILWKDNRYTAEYALKVGDVVNVVLSDKLILAARVTRVSEFWLSVQFDINDGEMAALAQRLSKTTGLELLAA